MKKINDKTLLQFQREHLDKLSSIVQEAIEEEELIVRKIANPIKDHISFGQKISDLVARFGGSWRFIISFWFFLVIWILFNIFSPQGLHYDPYPYILLNLILSCIAALQAPIIMMSQNRQEEKDRQRSENDYLVNLKSEVELRSLHQKIDLLLQEQIETLYDTQEQQLQILGDINKKLKRTPVERKMKKTTKK